MPQNSGRLLLKLTLDPSTIKTNNANAIILLSNNL